MDTPSQPLPSGPRRSDESSTVTVELLLLVCASLVLVLVLGPALLHLLG